MPSWLHTRVYSIRSGSSSTSSTITSSYCFVCFIFIAVFMSVVVAIMHSSYSTTLTSCSSTASHHHCWCWSICMSGPVTHWPGTVAGLWDDSIISVIGSVTMFYSSAINWLQLSWFGSVMYFCAVRFYFSTASLPKNVWPSSNYSSSHPQRHSTTHCWSASSWS